MLSAGGLGLFGCSPFFAQRASFVEGHGRSDTYGAVPDVFPGVDDLCWESGVASEPGGSWKCVPRVYSARMCQKVPVDVHVSFASSLVVRYESCGLGLWCSRLS